MQMRKLISLSLVLVAVALSASACSGDGPSLSGQAAKAVKQRVHTYARAVAQVPTPNITNFPRRKTLAESTLRQSLPNHPWYVYVLGMNGNIVSYYVAKSVPVNDCDYLSSTQSIQYDGNGNLVLDAPSLEGIYQSSSGCNTLTFFDLSTDAEIQVTGMNTYVTDRPLKVAAKPIRVKR